jgi:peptidoglycan/xylan/chitin deacetylase (PgdA/CDA1 family)
MKVVKRYTRNGSIITMHDSLKSGDRMLELLPRLIEWLVAQGYSLQPLKI